MKLVSLQSIKRKLQKNIQAVAYPGNIGDVGPEFVRFTHFTLYCPEQQCVRQGQEPISNVDLLHPAPLRYPQ